MRRVLTALAVLLGFALLLFLVGLTGPLWKPRPDERAVADCLAWREDLPAAAAECWSRPVHARRKADP